MLSDLYKDAMLFAARLHGGQTRKGTEVVYLTHLLSVSALVMENGGTEEEGIAALLHDALEDQGDNYRSDYFVEPRSGRNALKRDIALRYGPRVLALVEGCTDDEAFPKPPNGERGSTEDWRAREQAYVEHLVRVDDVGMLRVSCADKLHNARTILVDLHEHGDAVWARFRAGNRVDILWYYRSLRTAFETKAGSLGDRGLLRLCGELGRAVDVIEAHAT